MSGNVNLRVWMKYSTPNFLWRLRLANSLIIYETTILHRLFNDLYVGKEEFTLINKRKIDNSLKLIRDEAKLLDETKQIFDANKYVKDDWNVKE